MQQLTDRWIMVFTRIDRVRRNPGAACYPRASTAARCARPSAWRAGHERRAPSAGCGPWTTGITVPNLPLPIRVETVIWSDGACMVRPMTVESSATEAEIWLRTIRPGEGNLSPEAAREWLRLQLSDADAERVRELSTKANSGQLTGIEERELENYLNVGRTLQFLKAKARLSLCGHIPS